ncbi:hypothetical protein ACQ4LE_000665 [Meloidogyne hapla]
MPKSEVNVMLVDKRGRLVRRIMLPTDGDGNLALETLAVSFPEAIGLMYRTLPDVYHQIEYRKDANDTKFVPPVNGWPQQVVCICKEEENLSELVQIKNGS